MAIRTITTTYQACDRCQCDDRSEATQFNEYPNGVGSFLHRRFDLCDRCVEDGFVFFRGRIMQESEVLEIEQ